MTHTDALSDEEYLRYSRHLLLQEVGEAGQRKLKGASVLIVGLGGLGAPASLYLAAAGVGKLILAEFDEVDASNLQRQVIYDEASVGMAKSDAAKQRLQGLNKHVKIRLVKRKLDAMLLSLEVPQVDVVLDCSDNLETRYAVSEACLRAGVPLVSGAAIGFDGQLMVFDYRNSESSCYHCLFPQAQAPTLNCRNAGVLGPVVATIGSLQALETIKLLIDMPSPQRGRFSSFDGRSLDWFHLRMQRDPQCEVCTRARK